MKPKFIKDLGMHYPKTTSPRKKRYWEAECPSCKKTYKAIADNIKNGKSKKCFNCTKKLHSKAEKRIYTIYYNMMRRCYNEDNKFYRYYGECGIKICDEWKNNPYSFIKWALENGYKDSLTIDRRDGTLGYSPNNCRWATRTTQARNTRLIYKHNTSGYRGVTYCGINKKWKARVQINNKTIHIGVYKNSKEAAMARDEYVIKNKLEHTRNFS